MILFRTEALGDALKLASKVRAWSWTTNPLARDVMIEAQGSEATVRVATERAYLEGKLACVDKREAKRPATFIFPLRDLDRIVAAAKGAVGLESVMLSREANKMVVSGEGGFQATVGAPAVDDPPGFFDFGGWEDDYHDFSDSIPAMIACHAAVQRPQRVRSEGGWKTAIAVQIGKSGIPYVLGGNGDVFVEATMGKKVENRPAWAQAALIPVEMAEFLTGDREVLVADNSVCVEWTTPNYAASLRCRLIAGSFPVEPGWIERRVDAVTWSCVGAPKAFAAATEAANAFVGDGKRAWVDFVPEGNVIHVAAPEDNKQRSLSIPVICEAVHLIDPSEELYPARLPVAETAAVFSALSETETVEISVGKDCVRLYGKRPEGVSIMAAVPRMKTKIVQNEDIFEPEAIM